MENLRQELLINLLDRPIAYHRCFTKLGGVKVAVMLSQAVYWSKRTKDKSGWFWKTAEQWEEETGMTRKEQEGARKHLTEIGVLEVKLCGLPAKLNFKVNFKKLNEILASSFDSLKIQQNVKTSFKITKNHLSNYQLYLLTPRWKKLASKLKNKRKSCQKCLSTLNLNIHHGTYESLGKEKPEHLFVLCSICHKSYHDKFGRKPTMATTRKFIDRK